MFLASEIIFSKGLLSQTSQTVQAHNFSLWMLVSTNSNTDKASKTNITDDDLDNDVCIKSYIINYIIKKFNTLQKAWMETYFVESVILTGIYSVFKTPIETTMDAPHLQEAVDVYKSWHIVINKASWKTPSLLLSFLINRDWFSNQISVPSWNILE